MYEKRLAHGHGLLPRDIVSVEDMKLLSDHYAAALRLNPDNFDRDMSRKFEPGIRAHCAEMYQLLREKGYIPSGMAADGSIRWKVQLRDEVAHNVATSMPGLPDLSENGSCSAQQRAQHVKNLQNSSRRSFRGLMAG